MSSQESNSVARPTTVTILGWTLLAFGSAAAVISMVWIVFSAPISEAGRELADDIGIIAAPLQFATAVGLGGLAIGLFAAWTAWSLLQRRRWALNAAKAIVAIAMIGWIAWMILFLVWMIGQSRLSADAPPPGASVIIVGFPTVLGLGALGTLMWLLNRGDVAEWFNHTGVNEQ